MHTDLLDDPDLDLASARGSPSIGPNPLVRRGRMHRRRYILHSFEPYRSTLTSKHVRQIGDIVAAIEKSIRDGAPLTRITIEGHAALFGTAPAVPYQVQAERRAVNVRDELVRRLKPGSADVLHRLDLGKPVGHGTRRARISNSTQEGRALNRRVEVTLSELDPRDAPYRWMCQLEMAFDSEVHPPTDLGRTVPAGVTVRGSGLLISERHVLTAAHNVHALKRYRGIRRGFRNRLLWETAARIRVTPFARGGRHVDRRPFGRWKGRSDAISTFPGFARPIASNDYVSNAPSVALNVRFADTDLAIVELKPKRNGTLGTTTLKNGSRFGWWGGTAGFRTGIGDQRHLLVRMKTRPTIFRALGFPDGFPAFRRGTAINVGPGVRSDDARLVSGHSGSPYWIKVGGKHRLLAVHHGDKNFGGVVYDYGVLIDRNKENWIRSIV